jgi:hypothetical protein
MRCAISRSNERSKCFWKSKRTKYSHRSKVERHHIGPLAPRGAGAGLHSLTPMSQRLKQAVRRVRSR